MATYRNATERPVRVLIRGPRGMDVYAAEPGETLEGPAVYERAFRREGLVPAAEAPAAPTPPAPSSAPASPDEPAPEGAPAAEGLAAAEPHPDQPRRRAKRGRVVEE